MCLPLPAPPPTGGRSASSMFLSRRFRYLIFSHCCSARLIRKVRPSSLRFIGQCSSCSLDSSDRSRRPRRRRCGVVVALYCVLVCCRTSICEIIAGGDRLPSAPSWSRPSSLLSSPVFAAFSVEIRTSQHYTDTVISVHVLTSR